MWLRVKLELKAVGVLFFLFFFIYGIIFSFSRLLLVPLIRWWKFGVLHFPVGWSELVGFSEFIFVISMGSALSMWVLGKIDKRNKN